MSALSSDAISRQTPKARAAERGMPGCASRRDFSRHTHHIVTSLPTALVPLLALIAIWTEAFSVRLYGG